MNTSEIKFSVIFDLDGVIINNMQFHRDAFRLFCEKHNLVIEEEKFRKLFGRTNDAILPELFQTSLSEEEIHSLAEEKEQLYRNIYKVHIKPVAGLIDFLESLKRDGIKCAVGTSAPVENIRFTFENLPIKQYFECIIGPDDITHGKPSPEVYLLAAEKMRVNPRDCFVFEDTFSGIAAGVAAGMKVIGLTTTYPGNELKNTVFTIPDFESINSEMLMNEYSEIR